MNNYKKTIFNNNEDYTVQTNDRKYKYILEDKTILYLNLEQIQFMQKEYWEEKKEKNYLSRCVIGSDKNGLKRCRKKCENCSVYLEGRKETGIISLDSLQDAYELMIPSVVQEHIDVFKTPHAHKRLHEEIINLKDPIDRQIMELKLKKVSEIKIGEILNVSQRSIAKRRKKISNILKEKLKDLKNN